MIPNIVCAAVGIALFTIFLGIIVWWVKPLPLFVIALVVLALIVYDLILTLRENTR